MPQQHMSFFLQHVFPSKQWDPPFHLYSGHTNAHTGSTSTCISCASAASLCHRTGLYASFPTGDQQQTMTHPSGFHLSDQYNVLITYYSQAKQTSLQVWRHNKNATHAENQQKHLCLSPSFSPNLLLGDLSYWDVGVERGSGGEKGSNYTSKWSPWHWNVWILVQIWLQRARSSYISANIVLFIKYEKWKDFHTVSRQTVTKRRKTLQRKIT